MIFDDPLDKRIYTVIVEELDEAALKKLCERVRIYHHTLDGDTWQARAAHLVSHCRQEWRTRTLLRAGYSLYPKAGWPQTETPWWQKGWVRAISLVALVGGVIVGCIIPALAVHREIEAESRQHSYRIHFSEEIETDSGLFRLHILYPSALETRSLGEQSPSLFAWLSAPPSLSTAQTYTLTLLTNESVQFHQGEQVVDVPRLVLRAGGGVTQGAAIQVRQLGQGEQPAIIALAAELAGPTLPTTIYPVGGITLLGPHRTYWAGWQRFLANPETVAGLGAMVVTGAGLYLTLTAFLSEQQRRKQEEQLGRVRTLAQQVKSALPAALEELRRLRQNDLWENWEPTAQRDLEKLLESLRQDMVSSQVLQQVGRDLTVGRARIGLNLLMDALALRIFPESSALPLDTLLPHLEALFNLSERPMAQPHKQLIEDIFAVWDACEVAGKDIVVVSLRELASDPALRAMIRQHLNEHPTGYILRDDPRLAMIDGTRRPPRYAYPAPPPAPQEESTTLGGWLELVEPTGNKVDPFSGGKIRNDALFYHTTFFNKVQTQWLKAPLPMTVVCPSLEDGEAAALYLNFHFKHPARDEEANFSLIFPLAPSAQHLPWDETVWLRRLTHAVGEAWLEFLKDGQNHSAWAELSLRQRQSLAHLLLWVARSRSALFLFLGISPTSPYAQQQDLYRSLSDWLHDFPVSQEVSGEQLQQWVALRPPAMKESFILMPLMEAGWSENDANPLLQPLIRLAQRLIANQIVIKLFSPMPLDPLPSKLLRWEEQELQDCLDGRVKRENYAPKFEFFFHVDPHLDQTVAIGSLFVKAANGSLAKLLALAHATIRHHIERAPNEPYLSLADLPDEVRSDANG